MRTLKHLILTSLICFAFNSFAYIPSFKMIMSRTAENHGRGLYSVTQDVIFQGPAGPLVVQEEWLIRDEHKMRVKVRGKGLLEDKISLDFVYTEKTRHFINGEGGRRTANLTQDWFEPYFHFRFSKNIKPKMLTANMVDEQTLKKPIDIKDVENIKYEPEDLVRLSRVGGVVNYAIGKPTPVGQRPGLPGMWIEQDQFHIRKLRLPSGLEIYANDYTNYRRKLWLPKMRTLSQGEQRVQIRLRGVTPLQSTKKQLEDLAPSGLDSEKNRSVITTDQSFKEISEFYSKFR